MTVTYMPDNPRNILIVLPNPLGDAIMATPAILAVRAQYPQAKLTLMGKPAVLKAIACEKLADDTLPAAERGLGGMLRKARELRAGRFDMGILFPNSFRSALLLWLGGVKWRAGYNRDGRGWMLQHKIAPPREADGKYKVYPALRYYLDLVESMGIASVGRQLYLPAGPTAADAVLQQAGYDSTRPLVMLNPGGAFGPSKLWPMERYAELADRIIEGHDAQIIINAAPNEKDLLAPVGRAMKHKPLLDFTQQNNTLDQLKSLVQRCRLVVTNDTGTRHIAAALGVDVVTLFGSTDPNWTTLDYPRERLVQVDVPCGPCQKKHCPLPVDSPEFHQCMQKLTVDRVIQACADLWLTHEEAGHE